MLENSRTDGPDLQEYFFFTNPRHHLGGGGPPSARSCSFRRQKVHKMCGCGWSREVDVGKTHHGRGGSKCFRPPLMVIWCARKNIFWLTPTQGTSTRTRSPFNKLISVREYFDSEKSVANSMSLSHDGTCIFPFAHNFWNQKYISLIFGANEQAWSGLSNALKI